MKSLHSLTELQIAVIEVLWSRGEATVREVHERLEESRGLARKTVGTLLRRLERYGVVSHREAGREFVYRADVTREEIRLASVGNLIDTLFDGDVSAFVRHAVQSKEIAPGDVRRIHEMLDEWTSSRGSGK